MKRLTIPKGKVIQRSGERNSKVYHVVSGLLRSYSIDEKGKEHIFMFAPEKWTVADVMLPEEPCELFIDALENSTVIVTEKGSEVGDFDFHRMRRRMEVLQKRIIMLMSASAIDRYDHFVATYPDIVQRVPQRMIASYLGITPEALSKIKGDRKRQR